VGRCRIARFAGGKIYVGFLLQASHGTTVDHPRAQGRPRAQRPQVFDSPPKTHSSDFVKNMLTAALHFSEDMFVPWFLPCPWVYSMVDGPNGCDDDCFLYVAFEMPDNDTYLGMIRKTVACTVYSGS